MRLPNFFIVGAPKAGTTSLFHHLNQHPQIYMSPLKETCYFSEEMRLERFAPQLQPLVRDGEARLREYLDAPSLGPRFGGIVSEWEDYCRLFAGAGEQTAVGEASPCYLWSKTAPVRIAACNPNAKVIMILRNPIDRAFSQYLQMANYGDCPSGFEQHLKACLSNTRKDEISMLHPFLEFGSYSSQVERYRSVFPSRRIGLWLYEETHQSEFLPNVYDFLGVDRSFAADTSIRHLEQKVLRAPKVSRALRISTITNRMRWMIPASVRPVVRSVLYRTRGEAKMSERERAMLVEYYLPDIRKLELVLGRDLSHWVTGLSKVV
jgi:hypothetical protein